MLTKILEQDLMFDCIISPQDSYFPTLRSSFHPLEAFSLTSCQISPRHQQIHEKHESGMIHHRGHMSSLT